MSIPIGGLTQAQATLLMPLWARAIESSQPEPLLLDQRAQEIVSNIEFDFDSFTRKSVSSVDYCIRASIVDRMTQEFLDTHANTHVVELGVGLDTRFQRLGIEAARWIELDLPEAMALRKKCLPVTDSNRVQIVGDLLQDQWMDAVQQQCDGGDILFIAEGVFYFFRNSQIQELVSKLIDRFPNAHLIFDAQSSWYLKLSNLRHPLSDSKLTFSLNSPKQVLAWDQRLKIEKYIGFGDPPYYNKSLKRLSFARRLGRKLCPPIRHFFKLIQVSW